MAADRCEPGKMPMLHPDFIKPDYNGCCFSRIPRVILSLLTDGKELPFSETAFKGMVHSYDRVILFLVDAFGWSFFKRYADRFPALRHFYDNGTITCLDSQFPSTTACHVTTIHTGLPVGQSMVFDWQYYEPKLDTIIAPLLFSEAGTQKRETLKRLSIRPEEIVPSTTLYQTLKSHGISSHVFQHKAYTPSPFGNVVFREATVHPYATLSEALVNMEALTRRDAGPEYIFFYFAAIDDICHHYGPDSPQFEAEIDAFFTILERRLFGSMAGQLQKTLFILTADHGQVAVNPKTTIYLNLDPDFTGFQKFVRTNRKGELIIPGGSCRNMIIYLRDGVVYEAHRFLAERLAGRADVHTLDELVSWGLFGDKPVSSEFRERAGDLMILPYGNVSVWWYERVKYEQRFYGHHGVLTPGEVRIPVLVHPF